MGWLTTLVNITLIAFAAYAAAQLTWRFMPSSEASVAPPQFAATNVLKASSNGLDANRLASHHLFGAANNRALARKEAQVVRETRLPLTLRGLIASERIETARAIIAAPDAGELSYAIGSTLPGNAKLEEIHVDKIILSRNGQLETLMLPDDKEGVDYSVAPTPGPATTSNEALNEDLIETPDQFRNALLEEPDSLVGLVNAVPKTNEEGRLIGFQLQPGKDVGFLQRFGLQPGDILTSVNGIQLDSPIRALEVIRELGEAGQVSVEVLRDDIPQSFVFSFDQG